MQKSKFTIEPNILEAISNSTKITNKEKVDLLRHVGYLTLTEKRELINLI